MEDKHWLERPENITKLWRGGWILLAVLVLAEFTYHPHPYFVIDGWFSFHPVFGFLSCVAMVLGAKLLGVYLKRGEDYYDRD
ncbi:MAG: hypothetical protein HOK21_08220 [Rhodospirillaceae bacterium]|jgi:hypothetical protein|nr:hypothetical protein [Rhodospirillaceae bacterium]MBT4687188.1 hypothetical protein [Rhodospirillaceae bacterium]MBT5083355.1 hypothetical protein [Rhodospirillaceae bacterium]MBT5524055.1 hypothetical protein [Rhodospirillaceae bacterium]MBT5879932.1 hypothetical protein [Rhodospirillaceae bacterium]